MTPRFSREGMLGLMLLALARVAHAQPSADPGAPAADASEHGATDIGAPVSLQLFEFLGEFTTEDGAWVDPTLLMEADIVDSARTALGREGQDVRGQDANDEPVDNCLEPRCKQ
jgi:hypothetical protein